MQPQERIGSGRSNGLLGKVQCKSESLDIADPQMPLLQVVSGQPAVHSIVSPCNSITS
jgi:hypothetical protein